MDDQHGVLIDQTKQALERIQSFDPASLPRIQELGSALNFKDAVDPATRLIELYRQLPVEVLEQLPSSFLNTIRRQADNDYHILNSILQFEPGSSKQDRDNRLTAIRDAYEPTFVQLHPTISYSVRKSTDFSRLERDARALIQSVSDRASALQKELELRKKEADEILAAVRKVAEEQGVSQQAIYFRNEADTHESEARRWMSHTTWLTVGLTFYAIGTIFLHKWPFLAPTSGYETAQLAVSKMLVFVTISFFLFLAARNYLAHRHNAVVNRHRQNALATYQALVKAAGDIANRDVVLAKAADCIFAAQPSGYGKSDGSDAGPMSLVNVAAGAVRQTGTPN